MAICWRPLSKRDLRFFTNEDDKEREDSVTSVTTGEAVNFFAKVLLVVVDVVVEPATECTVVIGIIVDAFGHVLAQ